MLQLYKQYNKNKYDPKLMTGEEWMTKYSPSCKPITVDASAEVDCLKKGTYSSYLESGSNDTLKLL